MRAEEDKELLQRQVRQLEAGMLWVNFFSFEAFCSPLPLFSCRKLWICLVKVDEFFVIHDLLLITSPEKIGRHMMSPWLVFQDAASAAAQRERESLDELRGYKDQLEVGSEAVSIVEPQTRGPHYFGTFFTGMKS